MDKEVSSIYGQLKQTLTYMLKNHDTELYRNEEGVSMGTKRHHYMHDRNYMLAENKTYWLYARFSDNHFAIHLYLCHRQIILTALMVLIAYLHTTSTTIHYIRHLHMHLEKVQI